MVPNSNADECSNDKRVLYLQKHICALSALVASKGAHVMKSINKFKALLPSLLDEVDYMVCNGKNLSNYFLIFKCVEMFL